MLKRMLLVIAGLAFTQGAAHASQSNAGYVTDIWTANNGAVIFNIDAGRANAAPSCQGSTIPNRFAVDGSTVAGQAMVSTLLTAHAQHKKVIAMGASACGIWSDTETVWILYVPVS